MNTNLALRKKVKEYVDKADNKTLKMVHAMLEAEKDYEDWDSIPAALQQSIEKSLEEAKEGKLIPHEEVAKKYSKWFSK
jgi:predicted transcriptional regulator